MLNGTSISVLLEYYLYCIPCFASNNIDCFKHKFSGIIIQKNQIKTMNEIWGTVLHHLPSSYH